MKLMNNDDTAKIEKYNFAVARHTFDVGINTNIHYSMNKYIKTRIWSSQSRARASTVLARSISSSQC